MGLVVRVKNRLTARIAVKIKRKASGVDADSSNGGMDLVALGKQTEVVPVVLQTPLS